MTYTYSVLVGAHQARSLAGLISYAGVLAARGEDSDHLIEMGNQIIEFVKKKSDEDYSNAWGSWRPG